MKHLSRLCTVTGLAMLLIGNAYAYIDPSVMTYTIQVVAGIIVAVGAVIGIVWTRIKKKAKEKLNIDLDGKKEVEGSVEEYDDEED